MYDAHAMPVPIPYHLVWVLKAKLPVATLAQEEPMGKIFARGFGVSHLGLNPALFGTTRNVAWLGRVKKNLGPVSST
eukprot:scaffold20774_cov80-Skeletonema_marinoi.AAC.2